MKRLFILLAFAFLSTGALQAQWHEIQTGIHDDLYGVFCIDADTAFVCGDNGVILKTEDGGETWVEKNRTNGIGFNDIRFAGNVGYASGNNVFFKTIDGGETWQEIWHIQPEKTVNAAKYSYISLKSDLFLIDTDTMYCYSHCLIKSTDAGSNWQTVECSPFLLSTCKTYFEDNVGYVIYSTGKILYVSKSVDYGNTWNCVFEKNDLVRYPWGFAVQFIDKDNVKIFPSTMQNDTVGKTDEMDEFYMVATNDGFETVSVETVGNNGYFGDIIDSRFSDSVNGCYIAFQKLHGSDFCEKCAKSVNYQYFASITNDGGNTWQFAYDGINGQRILYGIDGYNKTFYIAAERGYVYRTGRPETIYPWYDLENDSIFNDYETVVKPDVDSISWSAWSHNAEGDVVQHTLYVKREGDLNKLYCTMDDGDDYYIGSLREEDGRLWIRYNSENFASEFDIMNMPFDYNDVYTLPTGDMTVVTDIFYQNGRKVIVFAPSTYIQEWVEPLMFIEGVGPNFVYVMDTTSPYELFKLYVSCKFEDGENVYTTQNDLFDECQYHINIVTEDSIIGREWYYELQNPDGSITYQHLYYLADTVIDDRDIDIIVRNNTLYNKGSVTTHEYIYEENGKVYWWNATTGDFTTLYDFTAMPGDEWEIKVGTESITMHVDAVGETEYNNRVFKTLQVSDAGNLFSGTIVASVGHLTSFFPEKLMRKQGESSVEGLRCLWNGMELVFKYGDKDCDEVYEQLHLSLSEATTNSFSLYPNPTDGQLSITAASGGEYRITNLMGQTLLQGRLNSGNTSIDVSGLGKGMYFMTIEGRSKKFIVQ